MDRELCVLIYSQYSPASKEVIDFIQSLPYDIAAVTGMSLLAADSQNVRNNLAMLNISSVPCIFIKYLDGTSSLYKDEQVYSFIDSISRSITTAQNIDITLDHIEKDAIDGKISIDNSIPIGNPIEKPIEKPVEKETVMSVAMSIQQSREKADSANKPPIVVQRSGGPADGQTKPKGKITSIV